MRRVGWLVEVATILAAGTAGAQPSLPRLEAAAAADHAGQTATVCGQVAMTYCNAERGLRLTFAVPAKTPPVYVRVALADRAKLGPRPEERLFQQRVCVTGTIEQRRTAAVITLTDPSALTVEPGGPAVRPFAADAYQPCDVPTATMPRVTREVKANYPDKLRGRGVTGQVWLQGVVDAKGRVDDVRVTRSLDPDLDAQAIKALKQWTFAPARLDGRAVPVIVAVQIGFGLRR